VIHGERNRADTLNWWNELSQQEQDEILHGLPTEKTEPPTPTPQPTCPRCDGPHTIESCPNNEPGQESEPPTPTPAPRKPKRPSLLSPPLTKKPRAHSLYGTPSEFFSVSLAAAATAMAESSAKGKQPQTQSDPGSPELHTAGTGEQTTDYPTQTSPAHASSPPPATSQQRWTRPHHHHHASGPPPVPTHSKPSVLRALRSSVLTPLPAPVYDDFYPPEPEPDRPTFSSAPAPSGDKFLELEKPFKFDGNHSLWKAWKEALQTYFFVNAARFRGPRHALAEIFAATEHGKQPNRVMLNLMQSISNPATAEREEFSSFTQPDQVLNWTTALLEPHFSDPLEIENALYTIAQPQGNRKISTFMIHLDNARMSLGWSYQQTLPYLLNGCSRELSLEIARREGKRTINLTWNDFHKWGSVIEAEIRWSRPSAPAAPRNSGRNATIAAVAPAPAFHAPIGPQQERKFKCEMTNRHPAYAKVPSNLRGPIYFSARLSSEQITEAQKRNELLRAQNRCECCRCYQSDHKAGTKFQPAKPFRLTTMLLHPASASVPSRPGSPAPSQSSRIEELD
jgi:hypothetical protein